MKNFVQDGRVITVAAPAAVTSGAGVKVGSLFGVAQAAAASGADVPIVTMGVFDLPKTSAQAWTVGAPVYWDDTNKVLTTVSVGNLLVGRAVAVAANPSASGRAMLTLGA